MSTTTSSVFIVGASRGLGLALTKRYLSQGRPVIAGCRAPEKAPELLALANESAALRIETIDIDVPASINALAEKLNGIALDLLIHAAGVFSGADGSLTASDNDPSQRFGSIDPKAWLNVFRTNSIGPILVAEAFCGNLATVPSKVIFLSSCMGSIARIRREGDLAYRSSKAALNAAAKSLSVTLAKQKTIVACLHPGWVKTDMGGPDGDLAPEESAASLATVIQALTLDQTGQFFNYDGQCLPW
ncbi:MAG: SDR family oxidoreductase [Alphaproteobacteria bacterium]|nr:SDR family oxidoreductase [Alphaproteobacteria bacterium]